MEVIQIMTSRLEAVCLYEATDAEVASETWKSKLKSGSDEKGATQNQTLDSLGVPIFAKQQNGGSASHALGVSIIASVALNGGIFTEASGHLHPYRTSNTVSHHR
jgi:hypothetical protein